MSTIETNLVQPSTGTNLQLGASGDTVDIPSGATLDLTDATVTGLPSNRNILINGGFDIWQRGTSFTSVANIYTADRWFIAGGGAMDCTRQSGTSSDAFKYYLRAQRPSGQTHTSVNIGVALELSDVIALRGKTLTFSCKLRKGANYSPTSDAIQMSCGSNNDAADQDKSQNYVDGIASVTKTLTSSWQTFSVSHTVEADAVALIVRLKATTAGTAGAADYFDLAQAKMELGSQTEFEPKGYGEELALCQRYYQKSYDVGSAPGSVDNINNVSMIQMANSATSTANNGTRLRFVQRLRAAPSVTVYAPDGTSGNLNYSRHSTAASEVAATVSGIGSTSFLVYTTSASGMTAGDAIEVQFHYTADAEL